MRVLEGGGGHGNLSTIFDRACRRAVGSGEGLYVQGEGSGMKWNGMGRQVAVD
jgi:hypothetical protein